MNAIPTMPKPTTTIFCLFVTGASVVVTVSAPSGTRLIAIPGEDVAQDIV